MKKYVLLLNLVFLFSLNAFAQNPNFSGEWILNKEKSKMDQKQAASIESQTLKAEQTDKEIKITVLTKQTEGQVGGRKVDVGGTTNTYTLDGKEVTIQQDTQIGVIPVTFKGEVKDAQLKLQTTRVLNTPMGEVTITAKETWILEAEGKTLNIKRVTATPSQTITSELVFTKKT